MIETPRTIQAAQQARELEEELRKVEDAAAALIAFAEQDYIEKVPGCIFAGDIEKLRQLRRVRIQAAKSICEQLKAAFRKRWSILAA